MKNLALAAVFLGATNLTAGMDAGSSQEGQAMNYSMTTRTVPVLHRSMVFKVGFERFTSALEKTLGKFPAGVQEDIIKRPKAAKERLEKAEGAQGLMIFSVFDHGAALNMINTRQNAKQYLIGNPLTAIQMTQHEIRAALYAPLRVLVYEQGAGRTVVEYDQPSSQFGQFGKEEVTQVARSLDEKLERVLAQAAAG